MNTSLYRRSIVRAFAIAAAVILAGCASTPDKISGIPQFAQQYGNPQSIHWSPVVTDFMGATANFDQAIATGALPADDPAPKCFHDLLQRTGLELAPGTQAPPSFTPRHDGIISEASIAYIIARQEAARLGNAKPIATSCKELFGDIVIRQIAGVTGASGLLK